MLQPMEEMILPPKRQAVVDRLRRRIESYRRRQTECVPRFDQSFNGACEQQNLETTALQKRFIEGKSKRQAKKNDRKPDLPSITGNLHSSVHVQQKFGCGGEYEPPSKLHCGGGAGGGSEALTKFSVEIVQQLEFTTSAADSQPQQISTNVTVKALANASVKSSNSPPPQQRPPTPLDADRECKTECKSEVADDEFVGLDECAAALERDRASAFNGLDLGEEDGDDIKFEDLIQEISTSDLDFDLDNVKSCGSVEAEVENARAQYGGELSPAAQTLKHMAEQHQAAAGDWRYRGYAYRPRSDLHMHQQQQMHLNHPHNLQVSAAQHMQVSGAGAGHVSVAAQQGMYANFGHQNTPPPPHHQGGGCEYSVSQSQSINFGQQMRPRAAAPQQASGASPLQQPLGVAAAGISREQQAKMLQQQQQQMLRAQQQQMRPPPPEYKPRFLPAGQPMPVRRPPAQRFPHTRPYGPEWRHLVMQQQPPQRHQFPHHHQGGGGGGGGFGATPAVGMTQQQQMQLQAVRLQQQQMMQHHQRSQSQQQPTMSHLLMQQNQMMNVQGQMSNIHMSQSQSMSMQQSGMGMGHQGNQMPQNGPMSGQNGPMGGQNGPMGGQNGPMAGQNGPMGGQNGPMGSQNGPMSNQNGSLGSQMQQQSMQNGPMHSQSAAMHQQQNMMNNMQNSNNSFPSMQSMFPGQAADFNLDFLDNMPAPDANSLTAQELLSSLDNSLFNDIL